MKALVCYKLGECVRELKLSVWFGKTNEVGDLVYEVAAAAANKWEAVRDGLQYA